MLVGVLPLAAAIDDLAAAGERSRCAFLRPGVLLLPRGHDLIARVLKADAFLLRKRIGLGVDACPVLLLELVVLQLETALLLLRCGDALLLLQGVLLRILLRGRPCLRFSRADS